MREKKFYTLPKIGGKVLLALAILIILFWTLGPFIWLILSSLQTNMDLVSLPFNILPDPLYLGSYGSLLLGAGGSMVGQFDTSAQQFRLALRNSMFIAGGTMLLCTLVGALGGYAFSRFNFHFKGIIFNSSLTMQMFPFIAVVIPLYLLINQMGLRDNVFSLILVNSAYIVPYVVWIMRNFYDTVSTEIDDAALIDGADRIQALFLVILPLATGGMVASAVYAFLAAWNDFFCALIFTATINAKPVTVIVTEFTTSSSSDMSLMTTGGVLASIPPVILALLFQRYLIGGLTAGSVKG